MTKIRNCGSSCFTNYDIVLFLMASMLYFFILLWQSYLYIVDSADWISAIAIFSVTSISFNDFEIIFSNVF